MKRLFLSSKVLMVIGGILCSVGVIFAILLDYWVIAKVGLVMCCLGYVAWLFIKTFGGLSNE